jgi:hypothetical protein
MITLFQNQATVTLRNEINALGWDAAFEKYPAVKSAVYTRTHGKEDYTPDQFAYYKKVCNIAAQSLSDAFHAHNNPFDQEELEEKLERFGSQHSMSVGDIVLRDNVYYMVENCGFAEISI